MMEGKGRMKRVFERLIDRFRLFVLELKFAQEETGEAKAYRIITEDIEEMKEAAE